jgi:tetratricopeptide (TPR) repeat protein
MLSTKPLPLPKTLPIRRSPIGLLAALLALALLLAISYKPLLALYHQEQGGRMLAAVLPVGDSAYGGFACLRPFLEDLEQRAKVQRALEHLAKAQSLAPRQAHTYYQIGRAYCLLGDYERAVPALQTFAGLRPKNPLASLKLGFALLNACPPNGKCAAGLNSYDVWRTAGVTAEHFLEMAERERQRENYTEALLWYQQAQRMGRELRSTIGFIRYLILKDTNKPEAIKVLSEAIKRDRGWLSEVERIDALYTLALEYFLLQDYPKSREYFLKVVKLSVDRSEFIARLSMSYLYLGVSFAYVGDLQNALPYLEKSIQVGPRNEWAHINYGIYLYYYSPELIEKSKSHFNTALELSGYRDGRMWESIISFLQGVNLEQEVKGYCNLALEKGVVLTAGICN